MRLKQFILISLLFILVGCMDQCTPRKDIPGPYFLTEGETGIWQLNYDLENGNGLGRIDALHEIGWTDRYIFARYDTSYFFIDKSRDSIYYNSNQITIGPFNKNVFDKFLDSLDIKGIKLHQP